MIAESMPSYASAVQGFIVLAIIAAIIGIFIAIAVAGEFKLGRVGMALAVVGVLSLVGLAAAVVMLWYHADWVAFERSCRVAGELTDDCRVLRR